MSLLAVAGVGPPKWHIQKEPCMVQPTTTAMQPTLPSMCIPAPTHTVPETTHNGRQSPRSHVTYNSLYMWGGAVQPPELGRRQGLCHTTSPAPPPPRQSCTPPQKAGLLGLLTASRIATLAAHMHDATSPHAASKVSGMWSTGTIRRSPRGMGPAGRGCWLSESWGQSWAGHQASSHLHL
jgi:hypothetical protein